MVLYPPCPAQPPSPPPAPAPGPDSPFPDPGVSQDRPRLLPSSGARAAAASPPVTGGLTRPRRKRPQIVMAAVLTAVLALTLGADGPYPPRPGYPLTHITRSVPGSAITSPQNVITQARARQRRRQRRILIAVATAGATAWRVAEGSGSSSRYRQRSRSHDDGSGGVPRPAGLPRYYVVAEEQGLVVRATATGAVTGTVPVHGPGYEQVLGVTAADGGREFIVIYQPFSPPWDDYLLYSFRLTAAGRITGLRRVPGGTISGTMSGAMNGMPAVLAISPDGSKVALAYSPCSPGVCHHAEQIVVINLRTRARSTWAGGLQRRGFTFAIPNISWTSNTSLAFLGYYWQCIPRRDQEGCQTEDSQVRTLSLTTGGGLLTQGRVLLQDSARYPNILQALVTPGGTSLTIEVTHPGFSLGSPWPSRNFQVIRVPLTGGGPPRPLYRGSSSSLSIGVVATLTFDSPGQDLLITTGAKNHNGWIDHGRLHVLPPQWNAIAEAW